MRRGAASTTGDCMLSQTTEYALRAVVYLARSAPATVTVEQTAEETKVPVAYLYKVLRSLETAGIVRTRRGKLGGVTLAQDPSEVSLLDVVNAVDPVRRIADCPLGIPLHGVSLCPLHKRLDAALEAYENAFRQTTLAEMLAEAGHNDIICRPRRRR